MSSWIKKYSLADISDQSLIVALIEADEQTDLPGISDFAGYTLQKGSEAHVIADNTSWMLNSSNVWIRQDQSPYSDVYTKSEVDALLALMQYEIDSFYAYKYAVEDIINYSITKNFFETTAATQTITDITFTNNGDGTWSTSGTAAARRQLALHFTMPPNMPTVTYRLTGCPAGGMSGGAVLYCLYIWDGTSNSRVSQNDTGDGIDFSWSPDPTHDYWITIDIRSGTNANDLTFKPMITFKTYDDVTDAFRPHP